jgi:ABC-type dipeptide/oligopeptide/nickel transport system permease subunit
VSYGRIKSHAKSVYAAKDKLWLVLWIGGLVILWLWDSLFLNTPAFLQLKAASLNTVFVGCCVGVFSFLFGWMSGLALHFSEAAKNKSAYLVMTFLLNVVRSIPQIVGILIGYVVLTLMIQSGLLKEQFLQLLWMALVISVFLSLEVTDLVRERVAHYRKLDFFDAMLCNGIRESRIVNIEILLKNSRAHLVHKLIRIFAATVFLLCSVDFIISVGLSTDVSLSNFPPTLGGLLAKMDSKQDILAISALLAEPLSMPSLFFEHLQGISTAFIIVFTLLCMHNISAGYVQRRRLE